MPKKKEATPVSPVSLATMLGEGETFSVNGKKYTVKPLLLKDISSFTKEQISLGSQLFNLMNEESQKILNKWIEKYITDSKNEPMTLQKMMDEEWNVVDLKNAIHKLIDVSG